MLTLFRALPLLWRLVTILGLVVGLLGAAGGAYAYVHHQGYVDGYAKAHAECTDEKQKQETANQNAINRAAEKLRDLEKQLAQKDDQIHDIFTAIDLATAQDPHSGEQCLGADSVRHLNSFL